MRTFQSQLRKGREEETTIGRGDRSRDGEGNRFYTRHWRTTRPTLLDPLIRRLYAPLTPPFNTLFLFGIVPLTRFLPTFRVHPFTLPHHQEDSSFTFPVLFPDWCSLVSENPPLLFRFLYRSFVPTRNTCWCVLLIFVTKGVVRNCKHTFRTTGDVVKRDSKSGYGWSQTFSAGLFTEVPDSSSLKRRRELWTRRRTYCLEWFRPRKSVWTLVPSHRPSDTPFVW